MIWIIGALLLAGLLLPGGSGGAARLRKLFAVPEARTARRRPPSPQEQSATAVGVIDRAVELLRAGMPPAAVMTQLAALADDEVLGTALTRIGRSLELGDGPRAAIGRHVADLPAPVREVFDGMAAVWFVAEVAGAPPADMLARYAGTRRERADADRERAAALAGPRSTVQVLTWLPLLSLGLGLLIGADLIGLLTSVPGLLALGGGAVLLALGRLWMRALLRRAE